MNKKALTGVADEQQIARWKTQHGEIYMVEVDGSVCYLKRPDRKTLSYVATLGNNPIRANEALLANCWLGGDETIKTEDEKFLGVSAILAELIKVKEAEITKL